MAKRQLGKKKLVDSFFYTAKVLCGALRARPVLIMCICSFLALSILASEIVEGEGRALDTRIMLMMRNTADDSDPLGPPWFEAMMRDITGMGSVVVLLFVTTTAAAYLFLIKKKIGMLHLLTATGTGLLFSTILKAGFDRPRPTLVPHEVLVSTASFPSGHTMLATIVYMTLGAALAELQPRLGLKVFVLSMTAILTLSVGISRIYLGVHWPSDVLAGWLGGSAWAFMCWAIAHHAKE